MTDKIQIRRLSENSYTIKMGDMDFRVDEDRDFISKLSTLINSHWEALKSDINDTKAIRKKFTNTDGNTLYLTTWIIPNHRGNRIRIIWEDYQNDFLADFTFNYNSLRKEFKVSLKELK